MRKSTAQSLGRIMREYEEIKSSINGNWIARPLNLEDPYEWHFVLRGPPNSVYEQGTYHGKILLPPEYPSVPPNFFFLNKNGRFEVGKVICLSASKYHLDMWQPAWGIRTMLEALQTLFLTQEQGSLHSLDWSPEVRRQFAIESRSWICPLCKKSNEDLLQDSIGKNTPLAGNDEASLLREIGSVDDTQKLSTPSHLQETDELQISYDNINEKNEHCSTGLEQNEKSTSHVDEIGINGETPNDTNLTKMEKRVTSTDVRSTADARVHRQRRTSPHKMTFKTILWVLIIAPLMNCILSPFKRDCSRKQKLVYSLNVFIFVSSIVTATLFLDVIRRPTGIMNAFFFI